MRFTVSEASIYIYMYMYIQRPDDGGMNVLEEHNHQQEEVVAVSPFHCQEAEERYRWLYLLVLEEPRIYFTW